MMRKYLLPLLILAGCAVPTVENPAYTLTASLSKTSIDPPDTIDCVMDWSAGTIPSKSRCTAASTMAFEKVSCQSSVAVAGVFTCTLQFDSTYIPTGAPYTDGTWEVESVSAFDAGGTNRLTVYAADMKTDGQDVQFIWSGWASTEQTVAADPWGYTDVYCHSPVSTHTPVACTSDANGASLTRVQSGTGQALRAYVDYSCTGTCTTDDDGGRAVGGVYGATEAGVQALFDAYQPIWIYQERYFPSAIVGSGYRDMFSLYQVNDAWTGPGDDANEQDTNPGIYFVNTAGADTAYHSGNNWIRVRWPHLTVPRQGPVAAYAGGICEPGVNTDDCYPIPVGEWFEFEVMYQRSTDGVADGAFQLWINNEKVIDEQNVITWESGSSPGGAFDNFQALYKMSGKPTWTDWNPTDQTSYFRNARVSGVKLSDGNAGDPTAPVDSGGGGGAGGAAGAGGAGGAGGVPACAGRVVDYSVTGLNEGGTFSGTTIDSVAGTGDTLEVIFYAKASQTGKEVHAMIGEGTMTAFSEASAIVHFGTSVIDVRDGSQYRCDVDGDGISDTCPTYTADTWYRFKATLDIDTQTYDVDYAVCDGTFQPLSRNADFRDPSTAIDGRAAGSFTDGTIEIDHVSWSVGACVPDTCVGAGYECGNPPDGCGGTLDCTVPGCTVGGETCQPDYTCAPDPTGSIAVDMTGLTGGCTGASWSIVGPGGYTCPGVSCGDDGTASKTAQAVSDGTYTITWSDSAYACLPPDFGGGSPSEGKTVAANAQVFDLATNYTLRAVGEIAIDIQQSLGDCAGDPGCTAFGDWTLDADAPFSAAFTDITGTGDNTSATGSTSIYKGRDFTAVFDPEVGYSTPPPATVTAQDVKQVATGNYGTAAPQAFFATRTGCMAPCAVMFDAQHAESLSWATVKSSEFEWDFDTVAGASVDSTGFLAATVYDTPGTYNVTVTVDGTPWTAQNITVDPPDRTICINPNGTPGGAGFVNCPSASSLDHYDVALDGWNAKAAGNHVLFVTGHDFSTFNISADETGPMLIGSYQNDAASTVKPHFSRSASVECQDNWTYQGIDVDYSGSSYAFSTVGDEHCTVYQSSMDVPNGGHFSLDTGSGPDPAIGRYFIENTVTNQETRGYYKGLWMAIKGNTIGRTGINQSHNIRIPGAKHVLIQDNVLTSEAGHDNWTVRGAGDSPLSEWALAQGNRLDNFRNWKPQNSSSNEEIRYYIDEENVLFQGNTNSNQNQVGMALQSHDGVVRNNVFVNTKAAITISSHPLAGAPYNIDLYNNTFYTRFDPSTGRSAIEANSGGTTGIVIKNNLADFVGTGPCFEGVASTVFANNWCYNSVTAGECRDVSDAVVCVDPTWSNTSNPDLGTFFYPGSTEGVDSADQTVPIWLDYHGVARAAPNIDVGAVEQ